MSALVFSHAVLFANVLAAAAPDVRGGAAYTDAVDAYQAHDYEEAFRLLKPLAASGDPRAQVLLGELFQYGIGTARDLDLALHWYRKAAYQGSGRAQAALGLLYEQGLGVSYDPLQALMWYRLAAATVPAGPYQEELAAIQTELEKQLDPEELDRAATLVQEWQENVRAFQETMAQAERNHPPAQRELAVMYANGRGVPRDPAKAATWYQRAAEQGDALAQLHLGFLYEDGTGVPQNTQEAMHWYRRAAEQGAPGGHFHLGLLYYKGEAIPKDLSEAVRLFRQAAEQGDAPAQVALGRLYEQGDGVARDLAQAYFWYGLAVSGEAPARYFNKIVEARDRLRARLSLADLSRALELEREWRTARGRDAGSEDDKDK